MGIVCATSREELANMKRLSPNDRFGLFLVLACDAQTPAPPKASPPLATVVANPLPTMTFAPYVRVS